jgi:parvulin-like peptidyl-prolyl isomerase
MVAPFEEAAFNLDIGEISEPIQSDFGWHIIQTLGHTTVPISEVAYDQARRSAFEEYVSELRDEAEITIQDDWAEHVPESPGLQDLQQPQ